MCSFHFIKPRVNGFVRHVGCARTNAHNHQTKPNQQRTHASAGANYQDRSCLQAQRRAVTLPHRNGGRNRAAHRRSPRATRLARVRNAATVKPHPCSLQPTPTKRTRCVSPSLSTRSSACGSAGSKLYVTGTSNRLAGRHGWLPGGTLEV